MLLVESLRDEMHFFEAIQDCRLFSLVLKPYIYGSQGVFPPSSFDELNLKGWWYGAVEYQVISHHVCVEYIFKSD